MRAGGGRPARGREQGVRPFVLHQNPGLFQNAQGSGMDCGDLPAGQNR
jgi:hypothetical protein